MASSDFARPLRTQRKLRGPHPNLYSRVSRIVRNTPKIGSLHHRKCVICNDFHFGNRDRQQLETLRYSPNISQTDCEFHQFCVLKTGLDLSDPTVGIVILRRQIRHISNAAA